MVYHSLLSVQRDQNSSAQGIGQRDPVDSDASLFRVYQSYLVDATRLSFALAPFLTPLIGRIMAANSAARCLPQKHVTDGRADWFARAR